MSVSNDLIVSINYATMQINRHGATLILLFGTVGNLLNIWVLNDSSLQENSCPVYLFWSSITSLIFVWSGFLTRVLQGYKVNWPNENQLMCKIRQVFLNITWAMGIWCLVGASIDRFLCSHHLASYRRWNTKRTARHYVFTLFIFFFLIFIEVVYCFEASIPNVPVACYGRNIVCRLYNDWAALLFDIILPSFLLGIFGTLTIRNVRYRIVYPSVKSAEILRSNNTRLPMRTNDRNLTRMLLIQVLVVLVLDLPFGVYRSYASLTSDLPKSAYRVAIENVSYSLIVLLVGFTHSTSFYLYTLTGSVYRMALRRTLRRFFNRIRPDT